MQVEQVDFITIPTRDPEGSRGWYRDVLGLPADQNNPEELAVGQITLAFWNPADDGLEFQPSIGGFALRVPDEELEAKGLEFVGSDDTGVCHVAVCLDPDGNAVILHRRYKPHA